MAASSFVLCLSLVLLVTTLGCSAQPEDNETALISTLHEISNSTVESLRLHRQNTAALSDLQSLLSLPDMLQMLKEQITVDIERNMGSMKKELAGLNKVTNLTQEIQDLRAQLESRSHTVQNLEGRLFVSVQQVEILTEQEKIHNSTVQDLNKKLQESELRVQQLEVSWQNLNETCKEEEVDQDPECRQPQLQKIQDVVQRFNSSNDLSQLVSDLESVLYSSSVEYQQLQDVGHEYFFTYWLGRSGHTQLATLLLCAGLPVDTADTDEDNMLLGAARTGQVQMVKLLLHHGAQLEARDQWQSTPLIQAAYYGHLEVVKVLVEAGASTTARDEFDNTALENARHKSHSAVVQYLQQLQH